MPGPITFWVLGAAAVDASPEQKAELGIAATVVRPAEISAAIADRRVAVVTIANSNGCAVLADSGAVGEADGHVSVAIPARAQSLTITLTY